MNKNKTKKSILISKGLQIVKKEISDRAFRKFYKITKMFTRFCKKHGISYIDLCFVDKDFGHQTEKNCTACRVSDIDKNSILDFALWS